MMTSANSASLRDTYSNPNSTWSFRPSVSQHSNHSSSSSPSSVHDREWSMRVNASPVFDLSPTLSYDDSVKLDIKGVFHSVFGTFIMQYGGTAIAMPWEVAKILLQVQWNPRDGGSLKREEEEATIEEEISDDSSDEIYFQDPSTSSLSSHPPPKRRHVDEKGYIIRKSVLEESTRPEYVIPLTHTSGIWSMIKKIARFRNEGAFSLWKGLLTSCIINTLSTSIEPVLQEVLLSMFPSPDTSPPSLLIPITSHIITGLFLSPLDLVRTRLICQSSMPLHKSYTGPINALSQLIKCEGGLKGLYFHPHLFIPAFLDNSIRALVNIALPVLIASRVGITSDTHVLVVAFNEIIAGCLASVLISPFETVRRRLQIQSRGQPDFKACVETRPRLYHGVVDAMWRIVTEERSDVPVDRQAPAKEWKEREEDRVTFSGIGQLYHGFRLNTGAVIAISLLTIFGGGDEETGWTEL